MRFLFAPFMALALFAGTSVVAQQDMPEIWYNSYTPRDWFDVFRNEAAWPEAAKKVQVYTLEPYWLGTASDEEVLTITNFAKRHKWKLNVDTQPILKLIGENCNWTEGYSWENQIIPQMQKLKRLGVEVDWIHMDEPVWFGHYATIPGACNLAIPELVSRTAAIINKILGIYPNIQIVQIEPIPAITSFTDWRKVLNDFRIGLTRAIGRPYHMMQVDVHWNDPGWRQAMADLNHFLKQQNMGLGIFYNGSDDDQSSEAWIEQAVRHFELTEGTLGIIPAQAVFATWNRFPSQNLPETSAAATTWLINRYFRERSRLTVQFSGQGAHGRLTTTRDKPIPNATIRVNVPGVDFSKPLPVTSVRGVVPPTAAKAVIGFRLNVECGMACSGTNDVLVGRFDYREISGGSIQHFHQWSTLPQRYGNVIVDGETVGGTRVARVIAPLGQTFTPGWNVPAVTPNARFEFSVPAATVGGAGWFGNAILIWFDQKDRAISRIIVTPDPGHVTVATVTTQADGTFQIPKVPRVSPGPAPVTVEFDGGTNYRSATWIVPHFASER